MVCFNFFSPSRLDSDGGAGTIDARFAPTTQHKRQGRGPKARGEERKTGAEKQTLALHTRCKPRRPWGMGLNERPTDWPNRARTIVCVVSAPKPRLMPSPCPHVPMRRAMWVLVGKGERSEKDGGRGRSTPFPTNTLQDLFGQRGPSVSSRLGAHRALLLSGALAQRPPLSSFCKPSDGSVAWACRQLLEAVRKVE